ncbi:hypothetical protein BGY98DRAFT_961372 [Russula aff. rugulosa BPL654]|nr:hypothetical protein BGY98DRAFT_961372 [Russula aff. rugulosa BPL654]
MLHFSSTPTGTLRPTSYFFPGTLTRPLSYGKNIESLNAKFIELLNQRGFTPVYFHKMF